MAKNEFVPFATQPNANVYAPGNWSVRPEVSFGYQVGIADAQSVSTALRQATSIASMLAQWTADTGGADMVDDGNVSGLEAKFNAALKVVLGASQKQMQPYILFMGEL